MLKHRTEDAERKDFADAMTKQADVKDKKITPEPSGGGYEVVEGEATLGQATMAYQEPAGIFS